jgi:GNAT superfamily N-acetyltransferase
MLVRPYDDGDRDAVYDICLRTGDEGGDASGQVTAELMGDVWAGPYLALEPGTAFVAVDGTEVVGYVIGTPDTRAFEAACEVQWWPRLRRRYVATDPAGPDPRGWTLDERLRRLVHQPLRSPDEVVTGHPAHLHLDLLPVAQGRGLGHALLRRVLGALAEHGVPGVHVGVSPTNVRGLRFWSRGGFVPIRQEPGVDWLGRPVGDRGGDVSRRAARPDPPGPAWGRPRG